MRSNRTIRPGAAAGRTLTFTAGLVVGVIITVAGSAVSQTEGRGAQIASSLLYAIATLSVDTEQNANKLEILERRIDDLEARLPAK